MKTKTCVLCGREFVPPHPATKCCSPECSAERTRRYLTERHHRLYHDPSSGYREKVLAMQRGKYFEQRKASRRLRKQLLKERLARADEQRKALATAEAYLSRATWQKGAAAADDIRAALDAIRAALWPPAAARDPLQATRSPQP